MKRPTCPKCGKTMTRGPKAQSGKLRWECATGNVYCYSTTNPGSAKTNRIGQRGKRPLVFKKSIKPNTRTYIITAAQNATPIHEAFWACLQTARVARNAELIVVPIRYKNPTSRWPLSQKNDEIWAPETVPYLHNTRLSLNKNLVLLADVKTQPTAAEPLRGFESITGAESAILAHTKIQLESIATPANKMAKLITTTGACTVANYSDTKAGKLGEFHHSLAAIIVEINGGIHYMRHVHFDKKTASFTDLNTRYTADKAEPAPRPLALVMGDTHVDFIDPKVANATSDMIATLSPETLVWHDLLDGYSANPHHEGNPFNMIAKRNGAMDNVGEEVKRAIDWVKNNTPDNALSVVVSSNHNDFLARWIISNDWRTDPTNAEFYLSTALEMVRQTKMGPGGTEYPNPFPYWGEHYLTDRNKFLFLRGDQSFVRGGIELGLHGDRGPNGARGSARNLRRIGIRSVVGHSHSPEISEGCYQVGTSTRLRLEYNHGPSSWLNAHCLVHADGKRQLVIIINGNWKL